MNSNKSIKSTQNVKNEEKKINQEIIQYTGQEISLTKEQEKIYDSMLEFVKSDKLKELLLIGYAGTGKTTLVAKFINDLIKTKSCIKIVMAAPTHKAVNIAKSKLFLASNSEKSMSYVKHQ